MKTIGDYLSEVSKNIKIKKKELKENMKIRFNIFDEKSRKLKEDISNIFETKNMPININDISLVVEITVHENEISFDRLSKLSQLLKTTHINFTGETEDTGGCITCKGTGNDIMPAIIVARGISKDLLY